MLNTMARSTIKYFKKLGYSNAQIAEIVQDDPRTVARALIIMDPGITTRKEAALRWIK